MTAHGPWSMGGPFIIPFFSPPTWIQSPLPGTPPPLLITTTTTTTNTQNHTCRAPRGLGTCTVQAPNNEHANTLNAASQTNTHPGAQGTCSLEAGKLTWPMHKEAQRGYKLSSASQ